MSIPTATPYEEDKETAPMQYASTKLAKSQNKKEEAKRFRSRYQYWIDRGLAEEQAKIEAANPTRMRRRIYDIGDNSPTVDFEPENLLKPEPTPLLSINNATSVLQRIELVATQNESISSVNLSSTGSSLLLKSESLLPPLFLSQQEPGPDEIRREVKRLRRLGLAQEESQRSGEMTELSPETGKSSISDSHQQPMLLYVLAFLIVMGSTTILVRASASVLGEGWEGWLKAALLELSIIALSIYKAPHMLGRFLTGFFIGALVGLSLFVMHAAVLKGHSKNMDAAAQQSDELSGLTDLRQRLRTSINAEPASHLSRKRELLAEILKVEEKISSARSTMQRSGSFRALEASSDVDLAMRSVLTLLNILFAGILMRAQSLPFQKIRRGIFTRSDLSLA